MQHILWKSFTHTEFHCGYTYPVNKQGFLCGTWAVVLSPIVSWWVTLELQPQFPRIQMTCYFSQSFWRRDISACRTLSKTMTGITARVNVRYWTEKKKKPKKEKRKKKKLYIPFFFFQFHGILSNFLSFFPLYGFHKPLLSCHCEIVTSAFYFCS